MILQELNRLIADFMGIKAKRESFYWKLYQPKTKKSFCDGWTEKQVWNNFLKNPCHFHNTWEWLYPVIDQIEKYGYPSKTRGTLGGIYTFQFEIAENENIIEATDRSRIKAAYIAVVKFIQWHNENK